MKAGKIPYHPDGDADDWQTVEGALDSLRGSRVSGPDPAASTDHALARWDGSGGRTLQDSKWVVADSGTLVMTSTLSATTAADYLAFRPSDYGANKPAFIVAKHATADKWYLALWDGSDANGTLDFLVQNLTHNDAALAHVSQTVGASFVFKAPIDETVRLIIKSPFAWTITETTTRTAAGTSTCTFAIDGVSLGGSANSASTSEQSQSHSSANVVAAGADLTVAFSSTSGCSNLTITIAGTRTLS